MSKVKEALKAAVGVYLLASGFAWLTGQKIIAAGAKWYTIAVEGSLTVFGKAALTFVSSLYYGNKTTGLGSLGSNFGTKVASRQATAPRQIIYGKVRVGPVFSHIETTGTDNYLLHTVMVLAGHEVEELVSVRLNDTDLTTTTSTISGSTVHTVTNSKYKNTENDNKFDGTGALIRYTFEDGSQTAVNGFMDAQLSSITSDHKYLGCSYIYMQMVYDAEAFGGLPNISAVVKGKKVYDPRSDSTAWSDNPALIIRDYLSNTEYGLKATSSELNDTTNAGGFAAAANICDQTVTLADGVSTEKRYTSNGLTNMSARGDQLFQGLLSSMSGKLSYVNGQFCVFAGASQTPSLTITDDELLAEVQVTTQANNGDLFNGVKPIFVSATENYVAEEAPVYQSSTYLNADTPSGESTANYVKTMEVNYPFTVTDTMAQRLARIALNNQRETATLSCLVSLKYMQLQPNDWVYITNSRLEYTNKVFEVVSTEAEALDANGVPLLATRLNLKEIQGSVFDFATSDYEAMVSEGSSVGTGDLSVSPPTSFSLATNLSVDVATTKINITASWTNSGSDAIQGTEIKYGTSSGTYTGSIIVGKGDTSAIIPNLLSNTTYYAAARHFSENNVFSALSSEDSEATGASTTAPNAPTNLSISSDKPLTMKVSWTSPSNADIRAVKVYRRTANTTPTDDTYLVDTVASEPGVTQTTTFGKEDGLSAGTTYYFWVRAINFTGLHSSFAGSQSGTFGDVTGTDISTSTKITAGTGNNVGVLDGADSTYRIYAGHATPASAPFRVTQTGALTATNATITGNITANSLNVTGATVTGTLDASVITLNGNALSGLMGSTGSGSTAVLAVGADSKNQLKVSSLDLQYVAYDSIQEAGDLALDMDHSEATFYPNSSQVGWAETKITNSGDVDTKAILLDSGAPSTTTNRIYSSSGTLYWDGNVVGLGSGTITGVVAGTNLNGGGTSGSVTLNLDSTITGNHTFSNNVVIGGDLTVQGTTTTIDTTNLDVKDKNITLNYGSGDTSGNADGAGITIQDAVDASTNATLLWDQPNSKFDFSHPVNVSHGTPYLKLHDTSSSATTTITLDGVNTTIDSNGTDGDIIFKGSDGGSEITALTLDMSSAGAATFNSTISLSNNTATLFSNADGSSSLGIKADTSDRLTFRTGGAWDRLIIDGSGNATLGGNLTLSYAYPRINLTDTNNDSDYSIINNDGSFGIYDVTNSAYRLTISASGHLEIKKTTDFGNTTTYGGSTQRGLISWNAGTKFKIRAATSHALSLGAGGIEDYLYIKADGKIGIGTTAPSQPLQINTGGTSGGMQITSTDADAFIHFNETSDNKGFFISLDGNNNSGSNHSLSFFSQDGGSNVNRMMITNAGRVGIGATPNANVWLHVQGEIGTTNGTASDPTHTFYGDPNTGMFRAAVDTLAFTTGGSERARIDGSGRLGIGTSSPTQTLDVAGNIQATGSRSIAALYDANHYMRLEGNSSGGVLKGVDGGVITTLVRSYGDSYFNGGDVGIGTSSPAAKLDVSGGTTYPALKTSRDGGSAGTQGYTTYGHSNIGYSGGTGADTYIVSEHGYGFAVNGGTNALVITDTGKIGIAVADPDNVLHVKGSADSLVKVESTDATVRIDLTDNGGTSRVANVSGALTLEADPTDAASSSYINFKVDNTEAGRFDSYGRLGIGTDSAGAAVDIINSGLVTQLRLSNTASDSTTKYGAIVGRHYDNSEEPVAGLLLTSSSNATAQAIDIGGGISAANMVNQIIFHTASNNTTTGSNERMRIDNNGRVGIATNSPAQALEVAGSIRIDNGASFTAYEVYRDNILYGRVGGGSNQFTIQADNNKDINIFDDSGSGLTVKDGGNVGIGQSSPSQKLHVNGNIRVGSTDKLYFGGTTNYVSGSHGSNYLHFFTNSSERVRIDSSGRVGIGTDAPTAKLDVAGSIVSDGLTVNTGTTNTVAIFKSTDDKAFIRLEDDDTDTFLISKDGHFSIGENSSDLDNFKINLSSGALTINSAYTLPTADGVTGSFLKTDGSGNLSWSSNTITSFSTPGTGYLITSDSSSSSGVSGEPTLQYEGAYDGLTLLESGGHNAYLSFGASDDTAVGQIRFYSASTPVTLTGAAGELQLTNGDFSASGLIKAEKIQLNASGSDNPQIQLNNNDFGTFDWLVNQTDGGKFRVTVSGTGGAEMELESNGSDYTNAILKVGNQRVLTQTAGINLNGNLGFNDNYKAQFGTHDDLEIYHDGSNSFISEVGTGNFYIQGAGTIRIRGATTEENMIEAVENGAVTLYYNNSAKLETASGGVSATGYVTATTGFRSEGASLLRKYAPTWNSGNQTHDIVYNGWRSSLGDYTYLKAAGNTTSNHGMLIVGDQASYIGVTDIEQGSVTDDADNPMTATWVKFASQLSTFQNKVTAKQFVTSGNAGVKGIQIGIDANTSSASGRLFFTETDSSWAMFNSNENLSFNYGGTYGSSTGTQKAYLSSSAILTLAASASNSAPIITVTGDTNTGLGYIGSNAVGLIAGGSRKFYVDETTAYFQNLSGGVEIDGSLKLETASSPGIELKDTTNNVRLKAYAQNSNAHLATLSNHDLIVDTNNTEAFRVDTQQRVGIGLTAPSAQLHNAGGAVIFDQTNNGYSGLKITDDADSDYNVNFIMGRDQSNSRFNFYRSGRTQGTTPWADATPSKIAHISNASAYFKSKIGINTESPDNMFHIYAGDSGATLTDARYKAIIEHSGEAYLAFASSANSFAGVRFVAPSGQKAYIDYWHGTQGDQFVYSSQTNHIFKKVNTTHLTIDSDGNLDIASGWLKMGTTTLISPARVIQNVTSLTVDDITIDGSTISDGGDLTFDLGGDMMIDVAGGDVRFKGSTSHPTATVGIMSFDSNDWVFKNNRSNYDIVFQGYDEGSVITALRIDMSDAGAATFNNNVTAYSDERLKDNIETLDGKKVLDMRGVSFTRDGKEGSGVIAQELEQVAPELVKTADDEMGTKSVAYGNLVGYLIENAKRQEELIKELTKEINKLKKEVT